MSRIDRTSYLAKPHFLYTKNRILLFSGIILFIFAVIFVFDKEIIIFVKKQVSDNLIRVASFLQYYGNLPLYCGFACILIYAFVNKNERLKKVSWGYIKAQIVFSVILIRVLKIVFGRLRPLYSSEFTFFSLDFTRNSFPSGHATDAFISGVFLFYLLKYSKYSTYRFLPLVYAVMIALSRIVCFAHFASDVIAGMAIGIFGAHYFLERLSVQPEDKGQIQKPPSA